MNIYTQYIYKILIFVTFVISAHIISSKSLVSVHLKIASGITKGLYQC